MGIGTRRKYLFKITLQKSVFTQKNNVFSVLGDKTVINRDKYLNLLIRKKDNGSVKIITGIRRCGKSFLLFKLFHAYLNSVGIEDSNIIELSLDNDSNAIYRNPLELGNYICSKIVDKGKKYYIFMIMVFVYWNRRILIK